MSSRPHDLPAAAEATAPPLHRPTSQNTVRPTVPRTRRWRTVPAAVLLGLVGGWIALAVGGTVHHEVGPLTTSMALVPSWGGGTTVDVPPLGELRLDTHVGVLGIRATLEGVDTEEARALVRDPEQLATLKPQAVSDLRWETEMAVLRALLCVLVGGAAMAALGLRRVRSAIVGAGSAAGAVVLSAALASTTWNPTALAEPHYTGLLSSAPSVVGDAESIVDDFSVYGDQLAGIVQNLSGIYTVTSHLPLLPEAGDVVRVLHVSDLHLAPQSWDLIRTVAHDYDVDVIVDSGDITDHGTAAENRYVREIRHLDQPYVWVRGNHDSMVTEAAMRRQPGVVVLDGAPRRVAGLTFLGAGDPTFTPDKQGGGEGEDLVRASAVGLAAAALERKETHPADPVDVLVFHDPAPAADLDGAAPVALFGHRHFRKVTRGDEGTWLMVQGSTGGSGLRALEPVTPAKIEMSVLYLERSTGALLAYDDIQLGGLGLASAEITRQVVDQPGPTDDTELVAPQPSAGQE